MPTGDVELTILDNGATVVVPGNNVQAIIGTTSAGTANVVLATRNINTLISNVGYGPGVEAAALVISRGGVVLFVKAATNTNGASTAVVFTGTGTSVVTVTGNPFDTYLFRFRVLTGGTIGTAGIKFRISLDGGKTEGPEIALGTAALYVVPNTGITLNFAPGTLVAGDKAQFSTTEPLWGTAGVQAALNALQASSYALSGWGSTQIVGPMSGANATTIQGYLTTLQTGKIYTRAIVSARDVAIPTAWGGPGAETEAQWTTALLADFIAVDAVRLAVSAGHYNVPSQIPNPAADAPRYRRPLSWALAARHVTIPPQRHAGRVRDGALSEVVVDATQDPTDGFVYHDERLNPGFDGARFVSARTRIKKAGFFIANPKLMSQIGSVFVLLPHGTVMDIACGIVTDVGQNVINEDVRLNKNGTIYENEAQQIEKELLQAIDNDMTNKRMISSATVVVLRDKNVQATSEVDIAVTIFARGYVLQENVTIGFGTAESTGVTS